MFCYELGEIPDGEFVELADWIKVLWRGETEYRPLRGKWEKWGEGVNPMVDVRYDKRKGGKRLRELGGNGVSTTSV